MECSDEWLRPLIVLGTVPDLYEGLSQSSEHSIIHLPTLSCVRLWLVYTCLTLLIRPVFLSTYFVFFFLLIVHQLSNDNIPKEQANEKQAWQGTGNKLRCKNGDA